MIVLREPGDVAGVAHPLVQRLAALRFSQIGRPGDNDRYGHMIVVEPGDSIEQLERELGLPILRSLIDDTVFGQSNFSPCFETPEEHSDEHGNIVFELLFITHEDGAGSTLLIPQVEGISGDLLAVCQAYSMPALKRP